MDQRLRPSKLVPSGFKVDRMTIVGTDVVITIRHQSRLGFARPVAEHPDGFIVDIVAVLPIFRCPGDVSV
jgi:hypothetical protein